MSLARYESECRGLAEEAAQSLSEDDVANLREQVRALGLVPWLDWRAVNAERVASFVAATPSARNTQRQFQTDRLLLALAAYAHCHEAADLLTAASRLNPGGSYRRMAAEAGTEAARLSESPAWEDWPFEGPDPFDP